MTTLKRDFGFSFAGLFDTMIAARFLGLPEIGLQAVARRELGVELSKDSQKDDWSRRPLTPIQEAYALADVQHLLAIRARLEEQLRAAGASPGCEEECAAVAALEPARRRKDPDAYQKVKGARRLTPRALAILRELYAWREARAESTDTPAFKILGNETLLALAAEPPRTREDLARLRAAEPCATTRRAAGRGATGDQRCRKRICPGFPASRGRRVSDAVRSAHGEASRPGARRRPPAIELDPSVILPQRLIDRLAEKAPRDAGDARGGSKACGAGASRPSDRRSLRATQVR